MDTPQTVKPGVELDSPPPRPPAGEQRNLMQLQIPRNADPASVGSMSKSPQLLALQGLAMVKHGFNLLSLGLPAAAQLFSSTVADLEQMIPQLMADSMAGTGPMTPGQPGVAPPMGPPPPGIGGPGGPPMGGPPMGGPPMGGPPMQ